jgi:hypothetical protein
MAQDAMNIGVVLIKDFRQDMFDLDIVISS